MLKKVAILANGGDVSGFNAVIRAIIKTAENNKVECYGFIDGYRGLLNNDIIRLCTSANGNAIGILPKGGSIIGSSTNSNLFNYKVVNQDGSVEYKDLSDEAIKNIKENSIKGEIVLVIEGLSEEKLEEEKNEKLSKISIKDLVKEKMEEGFTKKEAIKQVAKLKSIPKNDVYKECLDL